MRGLSNYIWLYLDLLGSVLILSLIFYVIERLAPAEKGQPPSRWLLNLAYFHFILAVILLLQFLFNPVYSYVLILAGGGVLSRLIDQPSGFVAQSLFALGFAVVWDIWQYWVHRLQHAHPFFWESHKFHHNEAALNSSSQAKHHILHHIICLAFYLPALLLFGSLTPHLIAVFLMFRIWGFINHANIRLSFGGLTPIISGPQWHRIHHSIRTEHHDKNFAAFFPFIDILFGTFYNPRKDEYPATGMLSKDHPGELRGTRAAPCSNTENIAHQSIDVCGGLVGSS